MAQGKMDNQNNPQKKEQKENIYDAPEKQYRDKKEEDLEIDDEQTDEFPSRKDAFEE